MYTVSNFLCIDICIIFGVQLPPFLYLQVQSLSLFSRNFNNTHALTWSLIFSPGVSSNTNSSYEVDTSNLGSFGSCIPNSEELTHTDVPEGSLRVFSYSDLKAATRNFREALGEGGFGVVYKGYVDKNTLMPSRPSQGMIVAVKRLKGDAHQGHREWLVRSVLL